MLYSSFCEVFIASLWVSSFGSIPSYIRGWQHGVRLLNGTALRSCWASNHSAARLQLSGSLTSLSLISPFFGRPATSIYLLVHTLDRQLTTTAPSRYVTEAKHCIHIGGRDPEEPKVMS